MTLLPRLGLRRWLAHKVLGLFRRKAAPLPPHMRITLLAMSRIAAHGSDRSVVYLGRDECAWLIANLRHPLTPGVAGFYRGTEKT